MSPQDSDSSALSRRQILGLVGSAGTAGALTGAATGANLFDRERFTHNVTGGGTFSLSLGCDSKSCSVDQQTVSLDVLDLEPGDSGEATISITVEDNDGWVWVRTACPEPSALGNKLEMRLLVDEKVDKKLLRDTDDKKVAGSLFAVQKQLVDGAQLTPAGRNCFTAGESSDLKIEYALPDTVGSNFAGKETNTRFQFHAEQCRHNASAVNPFSDHPCEDRCVPCGADNGAKVARATFEYKGPETTVKLAQGSTGPKNAEGKRANQGDSVLSETVSSGDTVTADFHGETNYGPNINFIADEKQIACFHISCSERFGPGLQITGEHADNTYGLTVISAEDTDGNQLCTVGSSAKNSCNGGS